MKLKWLAFLCLTLPVFSLPVAAQERSTDEIIKVKTALVSVPVIVSDRQGRYIPDLVQGDFIIQQDGINQTIDFFATTQEPINVALLIDTSHSTHDVLGEIKSAANKFVKTLQPSDRAMIVSFDYATHVLSTLTSDQEQLKRAIHSAEIPKDLGTTLRDAVAETVRKQFAGITGRKAIILLTDGKDHGSYTSGADLIYSLQESDVIVYTVFFNTEQIRLQRRPDFGRRGGDVFGGRRRGGVFGDTTPWPRSPREDSRRRERMERENEDAMDFLHKLSDITGGRSYESKKSKFKEVFALIADELRHVYRLGYYPLEDGENARVHALRVKVARPDLVVRARVSYRSLKK